MPRSDHKEITLPKYLVQGSYTAEGLRGLKKDTAAGRRAAVQAAAKAMGGKLDALYFSLGSDDVVVILDLPDNAAAAALAVAVGSSGLIRIRTTPLFTVDEADKALSMETKYRSPGESK